jgi:hypothetical protein
MTSSIWFMLVTFSTVGYGDLYPATFPGRIITIVAIFFAATFMALPITIVSTNFSRVWQARQKTRVVTLIQMSMLKRFMRVETVIGQFHELNISGDGGLSMIEFGTMLRGLGLNSRTVEVRSIFATFDPNGSGGVDVEEFCHVVFPEYEIESLSLKERARMSSSYVDRKSRRRSSAFARMIRRMSHGRTVNGTVNDDTVTEDAPGPAVLNVV